MSLSPKGGGGGERRHKYKWGYLEKVISIIYSLLKAPNKRMLNDVSGKSK